MPPCHHATAAFPATTNPHSGYPHAADATAAPCAIAAHATAPPHTAPPHATASAHATTRATMPPCRRTTEENQPNRVGDEDEEDDDNEIEKRWHELEAALIELNTLSTGKDDNIMRGTFNGELDMAVPGVNAIPDQDDVGFAESVDDHATDDLLLWCLNHYASQQHQHTSRHVGLSLPDPEVASDANLTTAESRVIRTACGIRRAARDGRSLPPGALTAILQRFTIIQRPAQLRRDNCHQAAIIGVVNHRLPCRATYFGMRVAGAAMEHGQRLVCVFDQARKEQAWKVSDHNAAARAIADATAHAR